jgi:hypothetical protein
MATDNVTSFEQVEDTVRQGYADAATMYKGQIEALLSSTQALMTGCQAINAASLGFLQSRLKDGLDTFGRLAGCHSPESAIEIQLDFTKAAVQAYVDQFARLGEITGQAMNDGIAPFKFHVHTATKRAGGNLAA